MTVDADDTRRRAARRRPARARCSRAAAEVDEGGRRGRRVRNRTDNFANEEVVKRSVKKCKRRAFASAGQCRSFDQFLPPLDVRR